MRPCHAGLAVGLFPAVLTAPLAPDKFAVWARNSSSAVVRTADGGGFGSAAFGWAMQAQPKENMSINRALIGSLRNHRFAVSS